MGKTGLVTKSRTCGVTYVTLSKTWVCAKDQAAMSPLRISPRLQVPCAGPLYNKVLAGEGCPAAK